MSEAAPYEIHGMLGSPYTLKMRAVLRYRRLGYRFCPAMGGQGAIAHVKPPVIPVLRHPDGTWHVDSTSMIDELEALHPGPRSLVPPDPLQAWLAFLLEDFADEWLTKAMFHYRWFREVDQWAFAREGAFDSGASGRERLEELAAAFRRRQVSRMPLVGCTEANRPLIEESFEELVRALDRHVVVQRFLFGSRPSRADFALYGQLSQLASDPTPSARMREIAPYAFRWVRHVDDLGGVEGEWQPAGTPPSEGVRGLLRLVGEIYLPFLVANAAAVEAGRERFACTLRGRAFEQGAFRYQHKCLAELRRRFAALEAPARQAAEALLRESGGLEVLGALSPGPAPGSARAAPA